jgi:hypothetical protein
MVRSRFIPLKLRSADTLLVRATDIIEDLQNEYHLKKINNDGRSLSTIRFR